MIMIVVILMQENCNVHDALHDAIDSYVHQSGTMLTHILFYIVLNTTYTFSSFFLVGGGGGNWCIYAYNAKTKGIDKLPKDKLPK